MKRPIGISLTALLMSICNAMGWLIIDWTNPHARVTFALFTCLILLGYLFIWFYWKGRNWARIAILLTSLLTVFNLLSLNRGNFVNKVMVISEALLGIFLLWWLNTGTVRRYFAQNPPRRNSQ
jgi:hypothetical protein